MSLVLPLPTWRSYTLQRLQGWRGPWQVSQERLAYMVALYFSLTANLTFFRVVAGTGAFTGIEGGWLFACLFVAITALNAMLLLLVMTRWTARPLLAALLVVTSLAAHFMARYTIYLDPDMIRNVLHTDGKESGELLSTAMLLPMLVFGLIPAALLWRVRFPPRSARQAGRSRLGALAAALALAALALIGAFPPMSSLMRNHHEVRYLITPGNYLVSLASAAKHARPSGPKTPVGLHAQVVGRPAHAKPRLLVLVVGETVRAQNWGLNGYARQTTPQLARIAGLVNFPDVTACGTATEVSVPCMFSAIGRRDYDAARIRHSEGLLHVLEHAGIRTLWRDNQTGCKGVCEGLAFESFEHASVPGLCTAEGCADEVLLEGLAATAARQRGDMVVVLHQLGNHGPAYSKRYPARLAQFIPACQSSDLGRCSREQVVNAYDNAVLHTDDFLARAIHMLDGITDRDTALVYVSDHGESLGENGLFLHGIPYAIAPRTQTRVPMLAWFSSGFSASRGIDTGCLARAAARPASHDNLFHSILGLMQVDTPERDRRLDLFAPCEALDARMPAG